MLPSLRPSASCLHALARVAIAAGPDGWMVSIPVRFQLTAPSVAWLRAALQQSTCTARYSQTAISCLANSSNSISCASFSLSNSSRESFLALFQRQYADSSNVAVQRLAAAKARRERSRIRESEAQADGIVAQPGPVSELEAGVEAKAAASEVVVPQAGPVSPVQLERVLDHPALVITRSIEWGQVIFGFEQAQQYTVLDQDGAVVALLAEEQTGVADAIGRQLLRGRRSFSATVLDPTGTQILFRVRRPAYFISSEMYVEDAEGNTIGEVRQRWHLLKRNYDLYLGKRQFASIEAGFLAWDFTLADENGQPLALIDRNFSGFAKEIFTDAGKYVIHFGYSPPRAAAAAQAAVRARLGDKADKAEPIQQLPGSSSEVAVLPTTAGNQLVVARPLELTERMLALACAISVDYDYFSRHTGGGFLSPPLLMPLPLPGGGGEVGAVPPGEGAGDGAPPLGEAANSTSGPPGGDAGSAGPSGLDQDLGGGFQSDSFGSSQNFGNDNEIKWDMGDNAGQGGDNEEGGGVFGIVKSVWEMFNGDD